MRMFRFVRKGIQLSAIRMRLSVSHRICPSLLLLVQRTQGLLFEVFQVSSKVSLIQSWLSCFISERYSWLKDERLYDVNIESDYTKKAITKIDDILVHPLVPEHEPIPEDHIKTLIQAAIHQDTFGIVPIDNVDKFVLKVIKILDPMLTKEIEYQHRKAKGKAVLEKGKTPLLPSSPKRRRSGLVYDSFLDIELENNRPLKKLSCRMARTK
ncbi:hypothetical protein PVK06_034382 [Gossypium arboreum]|uniref:Uncharacterized protein n=1 Tax=Gossypium arboreum TaxID=29729 RepID=A0ABR0NE25_GOSAR|nr:hypothetical protein PVK06_034382 [Gossypium arboreum]